MGAKQSGSWLWSLSVSFCPFRSPQVQPGLHHGVIQPVSTTTGCHDSSKDISSSNPLNISLSILNSTMAFIFNSCQGSSSAVNSCASANSVELLHAVSKKKKAHVGQSSFCCPVHSLHGSVLELTYTHFFF